MRRQFLIALCAGFLASAVQAADRQTPISVSMAPLSFVQLSNPNLWGHGNVDQGGVALGRNLYAVHPRHGGSGSAALGTFASASIGASGNGLHLGHSGTTAGMNGITYSGYAKQFNPGHSGNHFVGLTPAVPEPSTYALMVCGLLAVGAVARRRNRT